jgi:hypothetical protein
MFAVERMLSRTILKVEWKFLGDDWR